MELKFEETFVKSLRKYSSLKNRVQQKVNLIREHPIGLGEPLKGNFRGFYSCPVKRSFIIIYLYCDACRKKGDDVVVRCSDCAETSDATIKFVFFGPHNKTYGR